MQSTFALDGKEFALWLSRATAGYHFHLDGAAASPLVSLRPVPGGQDRHVLSLDGEDVPVTAARAGDDLFVHLDGRTYALRYVDPVGRHGGDAAAAGEDDVRAPMPGVVLSIAVAPGQSVAAGDTLVVIESMKMETRCVAPRPGVVGAVLVAAGQTFERDQVLVRLEAA